MIFIRLFFSLYGKTVKHFMWKSKSWVMTKLLFHKQVLNEVSLGPLPKNMICVSSQAIITGPFWVSSHIRLRLQAFSTRVSSQAQDGTPICQYLIWFLFLFESLIWPNNFLDSDDTENILTKMFNMWTI